MRPCEQNHIRGKNVTMTLNQFGAVMTYAIEMEEQLATYYREAAKSSGDHSAEFKDRAETAEKLAGLLEQSRRQNVTEITLEPIDGLNAGDYALDLSSTDAETVNENEKKVQQFYTDVTPKINVREARQVLQRCLKLHNRMESLT